MKYSLRCVLLLAGLLAATGLRAATDTAAAWRAADDARVAAMLSGEPARLGAVFSDDLLYVHSNGKVDTKASFIAALSSGQTKYRSMDYEQREFREAVPGLLLMNGRVRVVVGSAAPYNELTLSYLAVYRLEKGQWRMLAWQSCRVP